MQNYNLNIRMFISINFRTEAYWVDRPQSQGFSDIVRHGEELGYLFRRNYGGYNTTDLSKYPEADVLVLRRMLTLFTNFAKYLNPTPEATELLENIIWPTVSANSFSYLDIGSSLLIRQNPKEEAYSGWNDIYEKYGIPPFDTY
ncbi:hypothetical protein NQ318_000446 [Aromia moschata]|uniref:Carboxylesterase type B domain-containing protein n=1 Tax=Aromia moschata TaxID=1265417 RepID=A0AAV8YVQ9_9CUCU|nr:hypothetical protein NQ318_000446 [Aromia moschata]